MPAIELSFLSENMTVLPGDAVRAVHAILYMVLRRYEQEMNLQPLDDLPAYNFYADDWSHYWFLSPVPQDISMFGYKTPDCEEDREEDCNATLNCEADQDRDADPALAG